MKLRSRSFLLLGWALFVFATLANSCSASSSHDFGDIGAHASEDTQQITRWMGMVAYLCGFIAIPFGIAEMRAARRSVLNSIASGVRGETFPVGGAIEARSVGVSEAELQATPFKPRSRISTVDPATVHSRVAHVFGVACLMNPLLLLAAIPFAIVALVRIGGEPPRFRGAVRASFAIAFSLVGMIIWIAIGSVLGPRLVQGWKDAQLAWELQNIHAAVRSYMSQRDWYPASFDDLDSAGSFSNAGGKALRTRDGKPRYALVPNLQRDGKESDLIAFPDPLPVNVNTLPVLVRNGDIKRARREDIEAVRAMSAMRGPRTELARTLQTYGQDPNSSETLWAQQSATIVAMRTQAETTGGDTGELLKIMAELTREDEQLMSTYRAKLDEVQKAGGIDARQLTSREKIESQIKSVQELARQMKTIRDAMQNRIPLLEQRLEASKLPAEMQRSTLQGAREVAAVAIEINELELQMLQNMNTLLSILRDEWGRYSLSADGTLQFEWADARMRYHDAQLEMQDIIKQQRGAMRRLADVLQQQTKDADKR